MIFKSLRICGFIAFVMMILVGIIVICLNEIVKPKPRLRKMLFIAFYISAGVSITLNITVSILGFIGV